MKLVSSGARGRFSSAIFLGFLFASGACADVVGADFDHHAVTDGGAVSIVEGATPLDDGGGGGDGDDGEANEDTADAAASSTADGGACKPGAHRCKSKCVVESASSCGDACTTCPSVANGSPTCEQGKCGVACASGFGLLAGKCVALATCLKDADGDGYGDPAASKEVPGSCPVGYTANATPDCHDGNANVHPGQTKFFSAGYLKAGALSFDYDCDGAESERAPIAPKASPAPGCTWTGVCTAVGGGYVASSPRGPGANLYCGSTTTDTPACNANTAFHCNLGSNSVVRNVEAAPIACR